MKTFVYTIPEKCPRNGYTTKTIRVWRVRADRRAELVASGADQFVDNFQLFMQVAEANKLMPQAAFERYPMGGHAYGVDGLRAKGYGNVTEV